MNIQDVVKNFMGKKITKEGNSKFWGTDDLHEHCLEELKRMNTDEKIQFLIERGVIDDDLGGDPVKPVSPPSEDFILVVDCDGDPQEVFSGNTNLDQVFQLIDKLDRESGYHPHSAWRWVTGGFTQVFDRIGEDPK